LLDSINWISEPRISPDGKWVAFSDHENTGGDDEGSVAVIGPDGHEKKLSSGWSSVQGILWSPFGNEIWFTASDSGSANNLHGVTLAGKLRNIVNVPGGMWLEDIRNGIALMITQHHNQGIRGISPGGKDERELGWLGWSYFRDFSRDGKKVLFEEQADGGGPNYTVFLRDTDGSPPVRIGEGEGRAISPDNKWVITKPHIGQLSVVPTGAGEPRVLTHDNVSYNTVRYLPDGKQLLATGIEAGHGRRDYLIDVSNGNAKPITPEGVFGTALSPDGRSVAVIGRDGNNGIWPLDGSGLRPIPGLDSKYFVTGWAPDGASLYAMSTQRNRGAAKLYRVNVATGKMEPYKVFGAEVAATGANVGGTRFSTDGDAYVYSYTQVLSQAYLVKGLK
jgi:Tol biopolymer transport system component